MEGGGGVTTQSASGGNVGIGYPMNIEAGGGVNPFDNKLNLTDTESQNALTQTISGRYNSMVITKNLAMEIVQFNRYNPQFDNMMSTHGNYDLRLPADKMQLFLANKYIILNECVQLLLGDDNVASTQTVYPGPKTVVTKKKKKK
jgi:membrane-bound lytic murein transglycosylase D